LDGEIANAAVDLCKPGVGSLSLVAAKKQILQGMGPY